MGSRIRVNVLVVQSHDLQVVCSGIGTWGRADLNEAVEIYYSN